MHTSIATREAGELWHQQLIRSLPAAVFACDANGRMTMFNEAAAALWGRAPALGEPMADVIHRAYLPDGTPIPPHELPMAVALRERRAIHGREIVIERRDGARRSVLSHPQPLYHASGELIGAINMMVDITERNRAAEELAATRDQLSAQVAMLTRLSELSRRLHATHDLAPALRAILQTLVDLHGGARGLLALYDEATGCLAVGASVNFDDDALGPVRRIVPEPSAGATGTAFATRRRVIVEDVETDARFDSLRQNARRTGFRAVHSTPVLTRGGDILGVLSVYFRERRAPTPHEMDLADMCALHAADAIEGARDELAVRESEQRFRTMADHAPVMIWVREPDGACSFLSRSWYDFTGQTRERALGSGWLEAVNPIDRTFVQAIYLSASERREPFRIEYRLRAADGDYHWVIDAAAPRFDDDGTFHGYVGSVIDITERKRTEVALQESEARFRRMADSAPVLIWVSDADKQRTWLNQPWLDFVGRSMAQEIGTGWTEDVHPADVGRCVQAFAAAFDAREPYASEYRLRRRDGEFRRIVDRGVPLYDGAGSFAGYIGSCFDVTDERRKEQALREARNQLRTVTDTMAALVTRCTRDLRFAWANKGYMLWRGLAADQVAGMRIEDVVGARTFARLQPYIDRVLAGEVVEFEIQVDVPGRGTPWLYVSYVPTHEDGGELPDGWVSVVIDITERKRLEQAMKDADRRKDEFLASLAHELRNPLAPMQNALAIMSLRHDDAEEVERARAMLQRQMGQMVRLIDDLLDVNRISRGQIQLRRARIDVAAAVASAIETSRPLINEHGHALAVDVPASPIEIDADLTRLAQVFANLLNNAAKYTRRSGHLGVRVAREGGEAIVEVRDDGAGIPPERLAHVFDMFTQFDSGVATAHDGLGIGLAIAKRLVELHGGTIEAASEGAGRGSVFRVRLPALATSEPATPSNAGVDASAVGAGAVRRRVLVAEDHKDSAASLARLLEILGHTVRVAHDGVEAVALAEAFRPDVILLDIGMPRMNGYEACARLRASPPTRDAVIVALTGWGQESDRQRSREAGFDRHLVKPVDLDALEAVLARSCPRGG